MSIESEPALHFVSLIDREVVILMTFRILVTGSRHWTDEVVIREALRSVWREFHLEEEVMAEQMIVLVHGGATGADTIAANIFIDANHEFLITEKHLAEWQKYGRSAGPRRNAEMVALGADVVLAFRAPGSRGTQSTIDLATAAGLDVRIFDAEIGGE